MPLSSDQQKNIRSLIDNAGAGTYEEVRDELYDHLVQAIEGGMARGKSSADAQQGALEEMGGESGLVKIEKGYVKATKRKVRHLFRAFLIVYLKSARWLIPLVLGLTLNLYILFPLIGISIYVWFVMRKFKAWRYSWTGMLFSQTHTRPISLRAHVLRRKAVLLIIVPYFCVNFLIGNGLPVEVNIGLVTIALIVVDYSLAFIDYARKNWLKIA